ncbi:hypothetical protein EV361DRAFT_936787 [Lentinula raphanica]|nr:hypothetical protein EV361DRAFT_936787 [Lentinula raphanica]
MDSPLSLSDAGTPHSPPASEIYGPLPDEPTPNEPAVDEWTNHSSNGWDSGWGYSQRYSEWGINSHLTRSTVLRAVRTDFGAANLTAVGTDDRNTSLDHLDSRVWSSIQVYRSSDEGRREGAPFPTFTLPQVEQRFQQVQAAIRTRLETKEVLSGEIEAMAAVLAEKKRKVAQIEAELVSLDSTRDELQDLYLIAHARLS